MAETCALLSAVWFTNSTLALIKVAFLADEHDAEGTGNRNDEEAEQHYQCHPDCSLHRSSSLCTLTGDEVTEFADRLDLEIDCDSVTSDIAWTECFTDSDEGFTM